MARDQVVNEGDPVDFSRVDKQVCIEVIGDNLAESSSGAGDGFTAATGAAAGGDDHLVRGRGLFAAIRDLAPALGLGLQVRFLGAAAGVRRPALGRTAADVTIAGAFTGQGVEYCF